MSRLGNVLHKALLLLLSALMIVSCKARVDKKIYTIGVITPGKTYEEVLKGLKSEIRSSEFAGRINFMIQDFPRTKEEFETAAKTLANQKPDLIYAISTPSARAAKAVIKNIPIVFNVIGDPLGVGLVESFQKPGGNLTGCTNLSRELSAKRLEIFLEAFPKVKRVMTFYDPSNAFSLLAMKDLRTAADKFKVRIIEHTVSRPHDLRNLLLSLKKNDADGIYLLPDAMVLTLIDEIVKASHELKMPLVAHEDSLVEKGATISYGADFFNLGKLSFLQVKAILLGEKPKDLPVFIPDAIHLSINRRVAETMDYRLSNELFFLADRVID